MGDIRNKMNLKQQQLAVVQLPTELERQFSEEGSWTKYTEVPEQTQDAILLFAKDKASLDGLIAALMPRVTDKTLIWFAYPKKTSKRYKSDVTRDKGWEILERYGYRPIRQISLDEDWTALQFRPMTEEEKAEEKAGEEGK